MCHLNQRESVTFLLAEQNTHLALRHAHHGYILENGRVVLDGPGADLGDGRRHSFRDTKSYRRRKRWLA